MKEYKVGDYLVHESSGVCKVCEIKEQALQGKGSEKLYYSLEPVFSRGSHILTPVDTKVRIRDVTSVAEFDALLDRVPSMEVIVEENSRVRAEIYKAQISLFDNDALARVLKTVYLRKVQRLASGKKVMSSDEKVMQIAGKKLFEEMAFARKCEVAEVEDMFFERLDREKKAIIREEEAKQNKK